MRLKVETPRPDPSGSDGRRRSFKMAPVYCPLLVSMAVVKW